MLNCPQRKHRVTICTRLQLTEFESGMHDKIPDVSVVPARLLLLLRHHLQLCEALDAQGHPHQVPDILAIGPKNQNVLAIVLPGVDPPQDASRARLGEAETMRWARVE